MDEANVVQNSERLDLLNRQGFVDGITKVTTALSDRQKNACFAINGAWGVGKSFVLDMFIERAKEIGVEGEELPRFLIFRYNCWEYDYYEEPLVAIVASMLDQISENVNLLSDDVKVGIVGILKAVGKGLAKSAVQLLAEKVGVNPEEFVETVKDGIVTAKADIDDAHDHDQYFEFKKNLKLLQDTIFSLSKNQTVLFVVDELDRCLPEYTIKVLERLHHLFDGIPNTQVILSIDLTQLEHVVHTIFGEKTNTKEYLRKFIDFKVELGVGRIEDNFQKRFHNYTKLFSIQNKYTSAIDAEKFKSYILDGLEMRRRIAVIERCELIHGILIGEEPVDSSYMCMEMLFVILGELNIDLNTAKSSFNIRNIFDSHNLFLTETEKTRILPQGLLKLSKEYSNNIQSPDGSRKYINYLKSTVDGYVNTECLLGIILYAYRRILGFSDMCSVSLEPSFIEYCEKFWNTLQIVC